MDHRSVLLQFIGEGRGNEMTDWMKSHSEIEQLLILDEFKLVMQELAEQSDEDMSEDLEQLEILSANFENATLNKQLAGLKVEMAERALADNVNEIERVMQQIRDEFINNLLNEKPDRFTAQRIIDGMIQLEKEQDFYDPENWKRLSQ